MTYSRYTKNEDKPFIRVNETLKETDFGRLSNVLLSE